MKILIMETKSKKARYLICNSLLTKSGCWEWNLSLSGSGYGHAHENRKTKRAHRMSYEIFIGDIPEGMCVCHKCDNTKCINPDHLFLGTHQDNMDDMVIKNRHLNRVRSQYGNKRRAIKVIADFKEYQSYRDAGIALGISDNGVRKRIKLGWHGYNNAPLA